MNLEAARQNMLDGQIRAWNVTDAALLEAIERTPRHLFAPAGWEELAYAETQIPLGGGQCMMSPAVEARMLQALAPRAGERACEVGVGSGYVCALLSALGAETRGVEIVPELAARAAERLAAAGVADCAVEVGDGLEAGRLPARGFDLLVVTAALPEIPVACREALRVGGRLFAVVGVGHGMRATLLTRVDETRWATRNLFETAIPPIVAPPRRAPFVF